MVRGRGKYFLSPIDGKEKAFTVKQGQVATPLIEITQREKLFTDFYGNIDGIKAQIKRGQELQNQSTNQTGVTNAIQDQKGQGRKEVLSAKPVEDTGKAITTENYKTKHYTDKQGNIYKVRPEMDGKMWNTFIIPKGKQKEQYIGGLGSVEGANNHIKEYAKSLGQTDLVLQDN